MSDNLYQGSLKEFAPEDLLVNNVVPPYAPVTENISIGLDFQISPHFNFSMLTKTEHREWIDKNRAEAKNYLNSLARLAKEIMEPVYEMMGSLFVSSCFRCGELNKAVGGSSTSQHCDGEAVDSEYQGISLRDAFNKIAFSKIVYGQEIIEFDSWIHLSLFSPVKHPNEKCQKLIAKRENGKTVYIEVTKPL